jgi:hypothetical protein
LSWSLYTKNTPLLGLFIFIVLVRSRQLRGSCWQLVLELPALGQTHRNLFALGWHNSLHLVLVGHWCDCRQQMVLHESDTGL